MTSATQVFGQSVVVSKNHLPLSPVNIKPGIQLIITLKAETLDVTDGTGSMVRRKFVREMLRTPLQVGISPRTQPKAPMHPVVAAKYWREQQEHLEAGD